MKILNTKNKLIKQANGITLIALVITIIVLLILSSITIVTVTDIFKNAEEAKNKHNEGTKNEIDSLTKIEEKISMQVDGKIAILPSTDETPGELAGSGTETNPFMIESVEDLVYLSKITNDWTGVESLTNYGTFAGKYIKLKQNLDITNDLSYADKNSLTIGGLKEQLVSGEKSIYFNYNINADSETLTGLFGGTFDGDGCAIIGLKQKLIMVSSNVLEEQFAVTSLFGASTGIIKNLILHVNIDGTQNINISKLISPLVSENLGKIDNCNIKETIDVENLTKSVHISGVVAYNNGEITNTNSEINCIIKNINIDPNYYFAFAGIASGNGKSALLEVVQNIENKGVITNCTTNLNDVRIEGVIDSNSEIGGIVANNMGIVNDVGTAGKLYISRIASETNAFRIGGIVGINCGKIMNAINRCYLDINSEKNAHFGMIAGEHSDYNFDFDVNFMINMNVNERRIENCMNLANANLVIENKEYCYVGGIIGVASATRINNCYNLGKINSILEETSPIIGHKVNTVTLNNCVFKIKDGYSNSAVNRNINEYKCIFNPDLTEKEYEKTYV